MEMTTFTSLRIPYRAAEKKEASVVPLRHRSIEQLLPFPFAPDAILFKSFYIRWPQSTPPHRPPSLLQRRGHHSALARLLPECTLLSSGVRPLPPLSSQLSSLLMCSSFASRTCAVCGFYTLLVFSSSVFVWLSCAHIRWIGWQSRELRTELNWAYL